jgi:hypothetical protein
VKYLFTIQVVEECYGYEVENMAATLRTVAEKLPISGTTSVWFHPLPQPDYPFEDRMAARGEVPGGISVEWTARELERLPGLSCLRR